jgi:hypothetical protein
MPIVSEPPPIGGQKSSARNTSSTSKKKTIQEERQEALDGFGQIAQVPLLMTKQFADVGALSLHWPNVAKEIAALADSQEVIARVIDPLIKVGPYTGLVAAILPFAMQIAVNHGRVAAGAMGTVPGNALAAQVEAGLAQEEMNALKLQLQAEQEAQELRADIARARKEMANAQASQAATVVND